MKISFHMCFVHLVPLLGGRIEPAVLGLVELIYVHTFLILMCTFLLWRYVYGEDLRI
jgi:hypothetical protein